MGNQTNRPRCLSNEIPADLLTVDRDHVAVIFVVVAEVKVYQIRASGCRITRIQS